MDDEVREILEEMNEEIKRLDAETGVAETDASRKVVRFTISLWKSRLENKYNPYRRSTNPQ